MASSDNIRCIRKYQKKDGSYSYHAEVRRKRAKPLRKTCKTLTEAKNWIKTTESGKREINPSGQKSGSGFVVATF